MKALDEMREDGFEHFPLIMKDIKGNYLVKLGKAFFSCIEYVEPDCDQLCSIEQMFMLASNFHNYSKKSCLAKELHLKILDKYSHECSSQLTKELMDWNPSIFLTEAWRNCVKSAQYFSSQSFVNIYNSLPTQLIHGDITPNNTIRSKGKSFFIDFDKVRTDVRLLDFATFSGWCFLEPFLILAEEGNLSSFIQRTYGELEEVEKKCLPLIVLFGRCGVLEWSLRELKSALLNKDLQKVQQFGTILNGTISEINEIYNRIPVLSNLII